MRPAYLYVPRLPRCDDSIMWSTNHDQSLKLEEVSPVLCAQRGIIEPAERDETIESWEIGVALLV